MAYLSCSSPVGDLTLFEEDGRLVALEWGSTTNGEATPLLGEACHQLEDYFERRRTSFSLPLAPAGTDFQKRVWAAIESIPYGQVATYGGLARQISSAPRAIGGACGRNPIPIIVPCHRVIAQSGSLGGYSGFNGLESKQFLLSLENGENR